MPLVSIIVPCYNEQSTIGLLLEAVYCQTFSRSALEVVIADGMSTDGTREAIETFARAHPDLLIRLVENRARTIPAGLNRAIEAAEGEYIIRLDAHSAPAGDYVARCVQALQERKGDNVGGVWQIRAGGAGWQARSIAAAAAHPVGVGDARYRYTTQAGAVDTVPFGAFRKLLIDRIGPFDETLLTNEDYEFNTRIRKAGGVVWLDPAIRSVYFSRPNFLALVKQYGRYGYWKVRMLKRYPESLRWRQALPPLFAASLLILAVLAAFWRPVGWLLLLEILIYALILFAFGIREMILRKDIGLLFGLPAAIAAMHLSWGTAFLWSFLDLPSGKKV